MLIPLHDPQRARGITLVTTDVPFVGMKVLARLLMPDRFFWIQDGSQCDLDGSASSGMTQSQDVLPRSKTKTCHTSPVSSPPGLES